MGHTIIRQRRDPSRFKLLLIALAVGTLVTGCSSTSSNSVRVVDRNNAAPKRPVVTTGQYVVRPGDTLFSIAFRYGWDYKALAARNGITPPYTIRPGQAIRFDGRSSGPAPVAGSTVVASTPSSSIKTTIIKRPLDSTGKPIAAPATTAPATTTPATTPTTQIGRAHV